jgi:hypothetical protein
MTIKTIETASRWVVLAVLASVLAVGCFRKVNETVTEDSASLIALQGTGGPVTVVIDGAVVAEGVYLETSNAVRYQVARGRHEVEVRRGDAVVVRRQVYVGDGETRLVDVPAP